MGGKGGAASRKLQAKDNSDKLSYTPQATRCTQKTGLQMEGGVVDLEQPATPINQVSQLKSGRRILHAGGRSK